MEDSVYTKIIKGELPSFTVFENERFIAILSIKPISAGETLVIPKKQVEYVFDLEQEMYRELFDIGKIIAGPLKRATGAGRIGILVAGLEVPHVHLRLIPIHTEADLNLENAKDATPEDLKIMQEKILAELA